jgi:zinc and cadmium transporter
MNFWYAIISVCIVSLLSLLGASLIRFKKEILEEIITYSLAFSSGVLLGGAFLDLIPESVDRLGRDAYPLILVGIVTFFCLEKLISWHHHVEGRHVHNDEKAVAYLTLIGDGVHNFTDGAVIGAAYVASIPLGITTTIAVIAHEIPHELSDFLVLIHGGLSHTKALRYNFYSATTAIAGTILVLFAASQYHMLERYMLPFAAGNFIYIATSDLIPELLTKRKGNTSIAQVILLILGTLLVPIVQRLFGKA